uniref:Uncharacterized protein n=1 Tax=Candidatus Kentrum sp. SD TaxID=2126332 RepID=A0A450YLV4_9GAMM|nr:MAG: hypothetical protein BECKSD772F_GA0070984_101819 [Candidatus Kentron sp. SD]VFK42486.1 MAG: hypothetical protein BECKSD772E_GA0070983_101719 [Candidatus Kentron sp. SD]VFK78150.1 MAG: hypothetical protein BECKSD772D_GA0070982_100817 [Candidatus Kentron sp. SD]
MVFTIYRRQRTDPEPRYFTIKIVAFTCFSLLLSWEKCPLMFPNPENPEPKRSIKRRFLRFLDFLIVLFRIFRESD